jgi:hypothetical protein
MITVAMDTTPNSDGEIKRERTTVTRNETTNEEYFSTADQNTPFAISNLKELIFYMKQEYYLIE